MAKIKKCIRESENQGAGYLIIRVSGLRSADSTPSADFQYSVVKERVWLLVSRYLFLVKENSTRP
jgi:hypothetical protein